MRAPRSLLLAALVVAGCETSLDAIPADTVVVLDLDLAGASRPGTEGPQWANLFFVPADEQTCVALPEDASFSLNEEAALDQHLGGRGRDPFAAFSPGCAPPRASWYPTPDEPLVAPFVFVLEHEDLALRAEVDEDGTILVCDFPSCSTGQAF